MNPWQVILSFGHPLDYSNSETVRCRFFDGFDAAGLRDDFNL